MILRESSFNMTRGWGWRYWRGLRKVIGTRKGGSENIRGGGGGRQTLYTSKPTGGGGGLLKNWTASEGLLKFQASSFDIILNELSLNDLFSVIYLHLALNLWYPGPSIQCCVGAVVCAVEEIEISTLFRGKGGKYVQHARKSSFNAKCLDTFDAHCSSKFIITVVLDIRDRSLLMAWWGGESFLGDHWNFKGGSGTTESPKEAGITIPVPVIIIFCRHS